MAVEEKQRNNLFDLLKMISIAAVVAAHALVPHKEAATLISPLLAAIAVPIFILISAYLRTKKMNKIGVRGAYQPRYMFISFMSLMLAYIFIVVIEIIGCLPLHMKGLPLPFDVHFLDSVPDFLYWFFTGTLGFGSYYIPIMVELIVFLPLLYMLFKKNRNAGLLLCFGLNLAYDLLSHFLGMSSDAYRLLIFRFTFMLGCGIYLGTQEERGKKEDVQAGLFLFLGLFYVIVNAYIYEFPIFDTWSTASMFVAFFAYGFVYFMMKRFSGIGYHKIFVFGKASYHIFLVQMLFYFFYGNEILIMITRALPAPVAILLQVVLAIIITFVIGLLFYHLETRLRKALKIAH